MPSRTALVLSQRGDPGLFGALARIGKAIVSPFIKTVKAQGKAVGAAVEQALGTGVTTTAVAVVKSKPARVAASLGATGGAAAVGTKLAQRPTRTASALQVQGEFIIGPTGCPTGKVVDVQAHQRIIPIDRFGRPRRRINVLNVRALGRATRRLGGFQKRARRVEKQLSKIAPRSRGRSRRKVC